MAGAFLAIAGGERGILFPALALGRQDPTKLARNLMNTGDSNFYSVYSFPLNLLGLRSPETAASEREPGPTEPASKASASKF